RGCGWVPFHVRYVINREAGRSIIVNDRAHTLLIGDVGVDRRVRKIYEELLARLVSHIAVDQHRDGLTGFSRVENQLGSTERGKVTRSDRRVIRRHIVNRDGGTART